VLEIEHTEGIGELVASRAGFIVRVLRSGRSDPAGIGFVVGKRYIITCAHVVNAALGREQREQEKPGRNIRVQVDFPLLGGEEAPSKSCRVVEWKPPPAFGVEGVLGDVAGLELNDGDLPAGAGPARLIEPPVGGAEASMFGYPLGPVSRPDGVWVSSRLHGPGAGGKIQLDADRESSFRAQPGYSGSPVVVSDDAGDAVVGMLAITSRDEGVRDSYAISKAGLEAAWPLLEPLPRCPYRGLEPFRAEDAEENLFVGRSRETEELRRMVNKHPLVVVMGASGVGKSSLVTAGLLPALSSEEWVTATLQPGERPFPALAEALYTLEGADSAPSKADVENRAAQIRRNGLAAQIATLQIPTRKLIILFIDQLEDIFAPALEEERAEFFDRVLPAADINNAPYRLVCTLRADFWQQLSQHPKIGRRVPEYLLPLPPMETETLILAITEPARVRGVTYEEWLSRRIALDTAMGDGGLPLMEFALTELWPTQSQRLLTYADYEKIGGVAGALDRHADRVLAELEHKDRVRRIMLTLVRNRVAAAEATRCVVRKDRLNADWDIVEKLAHYRLLVINKPIEDDPTGDTTTVELAHEALIRSWKQLAKWIEEDVEFQRWLAFMEDRVARNEPLTTDAGITEAERWRQSKQAADIPAEVVTLIVASKKEVSRRAHARRRRYISFVVILVLVAGVVGFGISELQSARYQRTEAQSRMVADEADRAGAADPSLAMQLSLAAYRIAPTPEARGSLLRASTLHTATRLLGHSGAFNAVAISPDGHTLAAGSADQFVRLYDLSSANPQGPPVLSSLTDHIGAITAVAFSPDGHILASGSHDNTIRLWDLTDPHHPALLAVLTDQAMTTTSAVAVTAVAFSPDGHLLASGSTDHTARLWDVNDVHHPTAAATLIGHNSSVNTVAFSRNGYTLASGSDDRTVRLWDLSDLHHPTTSAVLTGHTDNVNVVTFSPDGRILASASRDNTVRLWDVSDTRSPTAAATLFGPTAPVDAVAFSRDGHTLASGSEDDLVRLWDLIDTRHPTALAPLSGHTSAVGAVTFTADGNTLASGSGDGTMRLWNLTDPGHPPVILTGSLNGPVNIGNPLDAVAFNQDGRTFASAGNDRLVRLWDLTDPRHPTLSVVLPGLPNFIEALAFSPDGRTLAIADGDDTVRLWDVTDPHWPIPAATLTGHTSVVESVAFSPDGRTLASSSSDHTIRLWDLTDPQHPTGLATLTGHTNVVEWVAFSPDGHTLASGGDDRMVRLWDVTDPHRPAVRATLNGHTDNVEMVAFSLDGHRLASGSQDGTVRLWDVTDPNHPTASATLTGHTARVEAVTFSPDGRTLVSASFDGTVRLWDLTDSQHPAVVLNHSGEVEAVAFTPDGHSLASGSGDGTIRLWDTSPDESAKDICALIITSLTRAQWHQYIPDQPYNPPCRS
jgi:WD40 repeat protein